ncbi:MAG TPA: J domain-containing protein [Lacipirellulaceae bacterium]|nr:J domain-containing protein [Lacipirellulaceae bacterium]
MCTVQAIAEASAHFWPDGVDWTVTASYLALIVAVAVVAYVSMSLHIRDYLRSLRRALVVISHYRLDLPEWVRKDRPRCLQELGLSLPCTSEDVLVAYRRKVKLLHPDRGGDTREFLRLQAYFEQAMTLVTKE